MTRDWGMDERIEPRALSHTCLTPVTLKELGKSLSTTSWAGDGAAAGGGAGWTRVGWNWELAAAAATCSAWAWGAWFATRPVMASCSISKDRLPKITGREPEDAAPPLSIKSAAVSSKLGSKCWSKSLDMSLLSAAMLTGTMSASFNSVPSGARDSGRVVWVMNPLCSGDSGVSVSQCCSVQCYCLAAFAGDSQLSVFTRTQWTVNSCSVDHWEWGFDVSRHWYDDNNHYNLFVQPSCLDPSSLW